MSLTVSIKFTLANTATAGAVVYKTAINNKANPADFLASFTFLTVKNLTITWGKPAVPTIKASVMAKISILSLDPSVYSLKPSSVERPFSFSNKYTPEPSFKVSPIPNCGIGFPVI